MNTVPSQIDEPELSKSDDSMTFAAFLEGVPPGKVARISDLQEYEKFPSGGGRWRLTTPRLHLHCDSEACSGARYFRFLSGVSIGDKTNEAAGNCYKYGEMPAFGPSTPTRLLTMLGRNRELFMKGRRCESQGLGIGAFVYYRRVVEEQRTSIIGEIIRVAKIINASPKTITILEAAQAETQFSKSLDMIKEAMPESLRIQGHNPMALLHDNLSSGLHAKSDTDCLEIASAVRVILAELADRLSSALKDEAEITQALGKLLNKK